MSGTTSRQATAVVTINGQPFFLAKDDKSGMPLWEKRESLTQEGDPTQHRRRHWNDWSRGIGDSRGVFQGALEHCEKAFLGLMGRALPGPAIATITTGNASDIVCFEEVTAPANRLLAGGGLKIHEIDPAAHTVSVTQTFGAGTVLSMQLFIDQVAIALGDATQFQRRSAAGAYSASTVTSDANGDYRYARAFGLSSEGDLTRGRGASWSKCAAADFYATNGNWTAEYSIGDASGKINQVFGHNRWDYVLKDEGLYSFDQVQSKESNLLTDLIAFRSAENRAFGRWYDPILLCSLAGLYRYVQQGAARTVGVEEQELNESVLVNAYPTAVTAFGKWAYVAWYRPANGKTYIVMHRRARNGDASFDSPLTAVSIIDDFTGYCRAMRICSLSGTPELYFARGGDVSYMVLTRDGRPAAYRTTGTTKIMFAPSDLDSPMTVKYFRGVEFAGRNAGGLGTFQWLAAMDGGAFNNVGAAVAGLTNNFGQSFWTLGANDSGRVVQLEVDIVNGSATAPTELRDVFLNYEERPIVVEGALAIFRLRDFDGEGDVSTRLTAKEQREALEAFLSAGPVTIVDPYGDTWTGAISSYLMVHIRYGDLTVGGQGQSVFEGNQPQEQIQLVFRQLEYA